MPDPNPGVPLLGIVMPAWNEGARISPTIEAIAALRAGGWPISGVVVADDGSTDGTADVARAVAARLGLPLDVRSLPHGGKAWAVRDGMLHAARTLPVAYLLMLDADNEVSIDQLASVRWSNDPRTVYIARRVGETGGRSGARPAPFRRLMSFGMRTLARLLLGLRYPDTQCGFKLFPAPLVPAIFGQMRSRSWVFDAELLVIARSLGLPVVEVPVVWQPRGVSRVPATAAFSSVAALVGIAARRARGLYGPAGARDTGANSDSPGAPVGRARPSSRPIMGAWRDRLRGTAHLITGDSEAAPTRRLGRLWLATALMLAVIFDAWLFTIMPHWAPGTDLYAAWRVDLADPWSGASGSMVGAGVFRYSPVIAQFASLFAGLPWIAAQVGFLAVQLVVIVLMAGRRWPYVVLPGVFWNLYFGNVDLLMGAAIVAGFRNPGAWAFLFLAKITPGIGVLWFAFRREWRKFGIALVTTALIVGVSFVLAPGLWFKWADALLEMSSLPQSVFYPPLAVRLAIAVLLVWFAARSDRAWLLPVACLVAVPNPWFVTFAILGASVVLSGPGRRQVSPGPLNLVA
jgi:hypothetical protein